MSVLGFQQKQNLDREWVGGVGCIQFILDFWNVFNFAKQLTACNVE